MTVRLRVAAREVDGCWRRYVLWRAGITRSGNWTQRSQGNQMTAITLESNQEETFGGGGGEAGRLCHGAAVTT